MSSAPFQFKRFIIHQDQSAFKVGTDSILFGSWVHLENPSSILDIGTGTGILALMIAQRCNTETNEPIPTPTGTASITALDIDAGAAIQARENADRSPWASQIECVHSSFQNFANSSTQLFDLIITNPPYFNTTTLTKNPALAQARNTIHLKFEDLIHGVLKLLSDQGMFALVLPVNEAKDFRRLAEQAGLQLTRLCRVYSLPGEKHEKRHLMEFQRATTSPQTELKFAEETIIIEEGPRHHYTEAFRSLTREFYC